jgi:hypothetical protein
MIEATKRINELIELLNNIPTQPKSWNGKIKTDIHYMVNDAIKLALVAKDEIKKLEAELEINANEKPVTK